jgi:2-methylaconitate cis-trans-isomerase PrpF
VNGQTRKVPIAIIRGGTSRGLYARVEDLPADRETRDRMILGLFGTPDHRQIDGLGGADVLTSKFAMIGAPTRDDADLDYTFVQVGIGHPTLDYNGNCGNISAGVALYAVQEGIVPAVEPVTVVRIHNTNTGKIFTGEVPVVAGEAAVEGDCEIAGVPGTGARIKLDYSQTVGSVTGKFFPTGNVCDIVENVPGRGDVRVTFADLANPVVYVAARDVGLTGIEEPKDFAVGTPINAMLEYIRSQAAVVFGLTDDWQKATLDCSLFPLLTVVQEPKAFLTYGTEQKIEAGDMDIAVRMLCLQQMHKAYAGTGTANLGATAFVPGTVVNDMLDPGAKGKVRFGHPTGVSVVEAEVSDAGEAGWVPTRVIYERTARRIMDGTAYVREDRLRG